MYQFGERLNMMCKAQSTINVENHNLSAKVIFEGRAQLDHGWVPDIKPWDLYINGQKLEPLDPEDVVAAIGKPAQSFEDKFMDVVQQQTYRLGYKSHG